MREAAALVLATPWLASVPGTPARGSVFARRPGVSFQASSTRAGLPSGMTSGLTKRVLPGRWVLSEPWGVPWVLVERREPRGGVLVIAGRGSDPTGGSLVFAAQ